MGGNHSRDNQRNSQPHQHVDPRHNTDVSTKGHLRPYIGPPPPR